MGEAQVRSVDAQNGQFPIATDSADDDGSSLGSSEQVGVKKIEAISQTWTKWSLASAYLGLVHDVSSFGFQAGLSRDRSQNDMSIAELVILSQYFSACVLHQLGGADNHELDRVCN